MCYTNNVHHFTVFTDCHLSFHEIILWYISAYEHAFIFHHKLTLFQTNFSSFSREDFDDVLRDMAFRSSIPLSFCCLLKYRDQRHYSSFFLAHAKLVQPTNWKGKVEHKEEKRLEFIEFKFAKHSVRCLKEDSKFLYNFSQPFKRCQKIQIFQFNFHHDHNWLFEKIFFAHFSKTTSQCTSRQLDV